MPHFSPINWMFVWVLVWGSLVSSVVFIWWESSHSAFFVTSSRLDWPEWSVLMKEGGSIWGYKYWNLCYSKALEHPYLGASTHLKCPQGGVVADSLGGFMGGSYLGGSCYLFV